MPAESVIERLRRLEAEATKGPWGVCGAKGGDCSCRLVWSKAVDCTVAQGMSKERHADEGVELEHSQYHANAHLIAESRNALTLLLRVAEAADRMTPGSDDWAWSDSMMADLHEAVRALRAGGSDVWR